MNPLFFHRKKNQYYILDSQDLKCFDCGERSSEYIFVELFNKKVCSQEFFCHKCYLKLKDQDAQATRTQIFSVISSEIIDPDIIPYIPVPPEIGTTGRFVTDIGGIGKDNDMHHTKYHSYNPEGITLDGAQIGKSEEEVNRIENIPEGNLAKELDFFDDLVKSKPFEPDKKKKLEDKGDEYGLLQ